MYAVIKTGGKQYKVAPGEKLKVEQIPADVGAEVILDQVLMVGEGESVRLGQPMLAGAAAFAGTLGSTPRIVCASLAAYLVSSFVDTEIFAWWRARVGGPKWLRVLSSNAMSTLIDSILFIGIAFAGVLPVLPLVRGQYAVKMGVTVISLPLIYAVRGVERTMVREA